MPHGQVNTYKFSNGYAMSGQTCTSNMAMFASPMVRLVVAAPMARLVLRKFPVETFGCPHGYAST